MDHPNQYKHHIYYMDFLRLIACILIVLVHVSAMNWDDVSVRSSAWQTMNIYDCLGIMGVPLFIMLSGALMLRADYSVSIRKILGKTFALFIVYHVWLLFYNFVDFVKEGYSFRLYEMKEYLILPTMRGQGIYHLWFLPVLMVLYLLVPILKAAFSSKKICEYYLALYVILGLLIPTLLLFEFPYKYLLMDYYNRTSFVMLTGYIGYFVAGHYIHSFVKPLTKKGKIMTAAAVLICYALTVVVCSMDALQKDVPSVILNNPLAITDYIATVGIYLLLRDAGMSRGQKESPRWLSCMSGLTFGIYLVHPFVLEILSGIGLTTLIPHPILMIPVMTVVVFMISGVISLLLQKLPVIGKYIV